MGYRATGGGSVGGHVRTSIGAKGGGVFVKGDDVASCTAHNASSRSGLYQAERTWRRATANRLYCLGLGRKARGSVARPPGMRHAPLYCARKLDSRNTNPAAVC